VGIQNDESEGQFKNAKSPMAEPQQSGSNVKLHRDSQPEKRPLPTVLIDEGV
jgi:hypothetical protein